MRRSALDHRRGSRSFELSAGNDLTCARDYEASLRKALDAQKRRSVELSQAAVRLRELERDVDASRDVYQSSVRAKPRSSKPSTPRPRA
jgi:uncharacterized protein involved in exopolysaccharide biosynthesis